ncbi:PorV/PorQ family protein [Flavilitoribacter nigricans]|uniref:PorV/PorQ family protein n=1 Tax=Flavilitoribacter nigricans (strain ATCC 23147 / DSM 23189 / NBRC 102662 / NCIMB 1420 / SS-2) TaxID=1122177 RepID=A0A2D0N926_FLAN2|nr:hypothetical protein [Flavilitoribacter nigricans]PHN05022.1 hypothetical protein CRP01_18515 [Flavilitoribacter nigricans DSM 23189 = NBRC 102662]
MKTLLAFILALGFGLILPAQNGVFIATNARSIGLGGSGVAASGLASLGNNPAGLADLENWGAGVQAEQRFLLSELQLLTAAGALPTASGSFGLQINYFGFEAYNEQKIGLTYARKLFDQLYLGAQVGVFNTRIPEYGSRALVTFDVGLLAPISREITFGFQLINPMRMEIIDGEYLATVLRFGLDYQPAEKIHLLAEVEKDIQQPVRVHAGLEYRIVDPLYLRLGVATEPVSMSFGFGYVLAGGLAIDVAASYHQILGFTPALGITYRGE